MNLKEEAKQSNLPESSISLILNSYDDIFSDFDPRHYARRALSDDFLLETKKAVEDKNENIEIKFLVPKAERKAEVEVTIKGRLREHFKRHYEMLQKEIVFTKKKGILMFISGIIMIGFAAYLFSMSAEHFWIHFLIVILEPAGWFTAWTGLDEIYDTTKKKNPELKFYRKMMYGTVTFTSY